MNTIRDPPVKKKILNFSGGPLISWDKEPYPALLLKMYYKNIVSVTLFIAYEIFKIKNLNCNNNICKMASTNRGPSIPILTDIYYLFIDDIICIVVKEKIVGSQCPFLKIHFLIEVD